MISENYSNEVCWTFKSVFAKELKDFILFQKGRGFKYSKVQQNQFKLLDEFFNERLVEKSISIDDADAWVAKKSTKDKAPNTIQKAVSVLRMFCDYLNKLGYKNICVIEKGHYPTGNTKFIPYVFTKDEINAIFQKAKYLKDTGGNNELAFYTLLCLYACCGLRTGEPLRAQVKDYDSNNKVLTIRHGKNMVTRLIPLSESVAKALDTYMSTQTYISGDDHIFKYIDADHYPYTQVNSRWHLILEQAEIPRSDNGNYKRITDLRHTFAVTTFEKMIDNGMNQYEVLILLAKFMGHVTYFETETYLHIVGKRHLDVMQKARDYIGDSIYRNNEVKDNAYN